MPGKLLLPVLLFFISIFCQSAYGGEPALTERLGEKVPLNTPFFDEDGREVTLGSVIDRPVILSFAYFSCKDMCNTFLSGLAGAIGRLDAVPGKDYRVITLSFDPADSPERAAYKKHNYTKAVGKPFPDDAWRFLTGDAESIEAVTGAAGFGFQANESGFNHPEGFAVLSADGRIIRYFYGVDFLPADMQMALAEAADGRVTASIKKAAKFCFSITPDSARVLDSLRAAGLGTLMFAAGFFIYLTKKSRKEP